MKKVLLIVFLFCSFKIVSAQRHELGMFLGGTNVIGDVGNGYYFDPFPVNKRKSGLSKNVSLGALYRFNINSYMGFRANLYYAKLEGTDKFADEDFKQDRNKSFHNRLFEGSLLFEYNFLDINDDQNFAHSPYMFFGVGLASYKVNDVNQNNFVLPFGVGYKVKFNYNWVVSAETGFRYTGKDDLDGVVDKLNKDWYVLSGLTLTYTFGRPACYCY